MALEGGSGRASVESPAKITVKQGEATAEEIDELEEAGALKDISHMPARVKCAVLGWRTLKEAIGGEEE